MVGKGREMHEGGGRKERMQGERKGLHEPATRLVQRLLAELDNVRRARVRRQKGGRHPDGDDRSRPRVRYSGLCEFFGDETRC
jgi:hypothetical protein